MKQTLQQGQHGVGGTVTPLAVLGSGSWALGHYMIYIGQNHTKSHLAEANHIFL